MVEYFQKVKIKASYLLEAQNFLRFLSVVGEQSPQQIKIKFSYLGRGYFNILVKDGKGSIDLLFQELFLNKGLYYYSCTLSNKKEIISNVILPILQQVIDSRFSNPQLRSLRKHILGKQAQSSFVPGDLKNQYGNFFEVLFRKWQLKIISDKEYIIELDNLLHEFLLKMLGHKEGERSEEFGKLLEKFDQPLNLHSDIKDAFLKIHSLRTGALHRLQSVGPADILDYHSACIYNYFQYLDEYNESQKEKFYTIRGKKYKRVKYGYEEWGEIVSKADNELFDWVKLTKENPCHDCFVKRGYYHVSGCDVEICPKCKCQLISCDCKWNFYAE